MGAYDLSLGTILVASWLNAALVAIEITQIATYFRRYPHDAFWNRLPVVLAIFFDTITTASICSLVYLYTISHFGDLVFATSTPWPQIPYLVGTGCSAVLCQTFLAIRIYRLTKQPLWLVFFAPCILAGFAGSIGMAVFLTIYTSLDDRYKVTIMVTLWTVASAATDIVLSAALVFALRRVKTDFASTDGLIRKLTTRGISSGAFSATVAVLVFACFRALPTANLGTMWGMCLGRVYTLTMLFNLNARSSTLQDHPTSMSNPSGSRDMGRTPNRFTSEVLRGDGVHVSRERTVHVDNVTEYDLPSMSKKQHQADEISLEGWEIDKESQADLVHHRV